MFDVIVIGAGIAGLVCAQQLQSCGYKLVVEKSRGLGGRVATRRLYDSRADRGACYLSLKGELLGQFVQFLSTTTPLPLVCCGDWCGGNLIESAMYSGIAAAEQINLQLDGRSLSENNLFDFFP
ncbi:MAG TPA: hypothetical protein DEV81_11445 [Cyanobacteria bacterium UBA11049]|nr:hypothetical protein [Cyanobacteria bacterium UBA11049]